MKFFNKKEERNTNCLLLDFPANSRYAESFRTLRTNLDFSSMGKGLKSILVTSPVASEGKTTTAVNLGYTIAQTGSKVLLIDGDLRRPRLTDIFALKSSFGFSDIISRTMSTHISMGPLTDYSIGDLLQLIKLQKRTGELTIESKDNEIAIYCIDGKINDLYWKSRPKDKRLGNALINKEILTKEEASIALNHQKKSVQRLGTILYTMGLVSKKKLSKELSIHMVEAIKILSGMTEGTFHFDNRSRKEIKSPISHNLNFKKLLEEFLSSGEDLLYIKKSIDSAIIATEADNLYLLPSGKVPHNPSEIIGAKGTDLLMDVLKEKFDFIIIDTPPVMPATDALLMAPRTDGTVLVVKSGNTERKIVKKVVENFKNANLPILGILLNYVDLNRESYYRYYKKYTSYYGD